MNVLGLKFDTKLQWSNQVASTVMKATRALNAIKLINIYFNTKELLQILTSNFYSVLYYNCEVWMSTNLRLEDKKFLMTASSASLKLALHYPKHNLSYHNLHVICNRATPEMYGNYGLHSNYSKPLTCKYHLKSGYILILINILHLDKQRS